MDELELQVLKQELMDYYGTAMTYYPQAVIDLSELEHASAGEIVQKAKELGIYIDENEEDKIRAINDFFKKEIEVYNMFLGERGVEKLLNGRKIGWTTLQEIDEIIDKQISPHININIQKITDKIKQKYSYSNDKNKEVLTADE